MSKTINPLFSTRFARETPDAWYSRVKRRELVMLAGLHSRWRYPHTLPASEERDLVRRGIRIQRSMRSHT